MNLKTLEQRYYHFNQRLLERYNLDISQYDYTDLKIKQSFYRTSSHGLFCLIHVHGIDIIGIMQVKMDEGFMRTALPFNMPLDQYPRPAEIRKQISKKDFAIAVKNEYMKVLECTWEEPRVLFSKHPRHIAHFVKYRKETQELSIYEKSRFIQSISRSMFPEFFNK